MDRLSAAVSSLRLEYLSGMEFYILHFKSISPCPLKPVRMRFPSSERVSHPPISRPVEISDGGGVSFNSSDSGNNRVIALHAPLLVFSKPWLELSVLDLVTFVL